MKFLRLVLITSFCLIFAQYAKAQVKIGDNPLDIDNRQWEVEQQDSFLLVTDNLEFGASTTSGLLGNNTADALMLKLFGYGLGQFFPTAISPDSQDFTLLDGVTSNVFLGVTDDGRMMEVPLRINLEVRRSDTTANIAFYNGVDTFGTADLLVLDSIFVTDNELTDSIGTLRTIINNSNAADNDTITGNEYIDSIYIDSDTLWLVENKDARLGPINTVNVDLGAYLAGQTFYLADGTIDENRTVDGGGFSLDFTNVSDYSLNTTDSIIVDAASHLTLEGDEVAIRAGGSDAIQINNTQAVKFRSSSVDTSLLINADGTIEAELYGDDGNTNSGFATILGALADGTFVDVDVNDILAKQVDSTIYNNDGVLEGNRTLTGGSNDLTFTGLGDFTVAGDSVILDAPIRGTDFGSDDAAVPTTIIGATANGELIDVLISEILATEVDSTIYNNDGTLLADRTLTGGTNDLTFTDLGDFTVNASGGVNVTTDTLEVTGETKVSGLDDADDGITFTSIVGATADGTLINVTADDILSNQTDSTIYNFDGVLDGNRTLTGGSNDLTFTGLGDFTVAGDSVILDAPIRGTDFGSDDAAVPTTIIGATANGELIDVLISEILATEVDSTIYNNDGTLLADRTLTGGTNDLTFTDLGDFTVNASGGVNVTTDTLEVTGETKVSGLDDADDGITFTSIVGATADGTLINVTADDILSNQTDSTIYNFDGTLLANRTLTGGTNDLTFTDLGDFTVNASGGVNVTTDTLEVTGETKVSGLDDADDGITFISIVGATSDGTLINVTADDILARQVDSTIYNNDGTLLADRTLTGGTNDLTFTDLGDFTVNASGGVNVTTDTLEVTGETKVSGLDDADDGITFTSIVGATADGTLINVTADDILSNQTDSTIYNFDGVLDGNRTLTGGSNDLTFTGLGDFTVAGDSVILDAPIRGTDFGSDDAAVPTTIIGATANGELIDVLISEILATEVDSTIYNNDGTLLADRTLTGGTNDLTFTDLGDFTVNASGGVNVTTDTLEVTGETKVSGLDDADDGITFTSIVGATADGTLINVTADDILSNQTDSTIYNFDGVLDGNRTLTGGSNDLTFTGLGDFTVAGDSVILDAPIRGTDFGSDDAAVPTTIIGATANGELIDVLISEILATEVDSTIYNNDGTLLADRTLTGGTNDLTFTDLGDFTVNASGGVNVTTDTLEVTGETKVSGLDDADDGITFTSIVGATTDGTLINVTADDILAQQTDSTIYKFDGTLTGERTMTMAGNNLLFVDGTDTSIIANDGRMAIGTGSFTANSVSSNVKLEVNGDILAVRVHSSSDRRFKKEIVPVESALRKVMGLEGVNYLFRTDEFKNRNFPTDLQLGFIAQDIEAIVPEVVRTNGDGYKAVDYAKVTALLVEAIKEQQAQITKLEGQLTVANSTNSNMANEIADIKAMIQTLSNLNVADED